MAWVQLVAFELFLSSAAPKDNRFNAYLSLVAPDVGPMPHDYMFEGNQNKPRHQRVRFYSELPWRASCHCSLQHMACTTSCAASSCCWLVRLPSLGTRRQPDTSHSRGGSQNYLHGLFIDSTCVPGPLMYKCSSIRSVLAGTGSACD